MTLIKAVEFWGVNKKKAVEVQFCKATFIRCSDISQTFPKNIVFGRGKQIATLALSHQAFLQSSVFYYIVQQKSGWN